MPNGGDIAHITVNSTDYDIKDAFSRNRLVWYGTCSSSGSTDMKNVVCADYTLATGRIIAVKFTYTNEWSGAGLKLCVNSTDAKPVKYRGSNLSYGDIIKANSVVYFLYDGTNYEIIGDYDAYVRQINCTTNSLHNILFSFDGVSTDTKINSTYKSNSLIYDNGTKVLYNDGSYKSNGKDVFFGEYSATTAPYSPVTGQLWFKDAPLSIGETRPLVIQTTTASLPVTISDANITSDMEVIRSDVGNPNVQAGDITVTTSNGSLTMSGTLLGATSITLWLCRCR